VTKRIVDGFEIIQVSEEHTGPARFGLQVWPIALGLGEIGDPATPTRTGGSVLANSSALGTL
jgi:hypothetical protein